MTMRNSQQDYGSVSKILHWLIAVIMIGLIGVGWYMVRLSDEDIWYWRLLDLHETAGLILLVLVPVKLLWMVISPNPKYLATLAAWEITVAGMVRGLFILAIVLIPLSGFLFVATNGEAITLYDLITIPDIGQVSKQTRHWLSGVHYYVSYGCAMVVVIHVLAAVKHHLIDKDATLRRMTFFSN